MSDQIGLLKADDGVPLLALNGDFYQRERAYAGDPRGLQIVGGELISAPAGGVSLWIDSTGSPHATHVISRFKLSGPDGLSVPFGLNEERRDESAVLYTPALGTSTHTKAGRELILEAADAGPWLPLRVGMTCRARVKAVLSAGDTPLNPGTLVLSIGSILDKQIPVIPVGAVWVISTDTAPDLRGTEVAISGGPVLLHLGKRLKLPSEPPSGTESYEFRSMLERHPRSAIGWNEKHFFWVEVDGRQNELSVGMTRCDERWAATHGGFRTGEFRLGGCGNGHGRPQGNFGNSSQDFRAQRKDQPAMLQRRIAGGIPLGDAQSVGLTDLELLSGTGAALLQHQLEPAAGAG